MLKCINVEKCDKLVKNLNKNLTWLGGVNNCYNIEKKTRIFIDEILKFVCSTFNSSDETAKRPIIYTDMEVELKIFGELIKPDYQIMR